jgi:hypothetical protein
MDSAQNSQSKDTYSAKLYGVTPQTTVTLSTNTVPAKEFSRGVGIRVTDPPLYHSSLSAGTPQPKQV